MADEQNPTSGTDAAAERVSMEQPAGSSADVAKALEHVNTIVNSIVKMNGEGSAPKTETPAAETSTKKSDDAASEEQMPTDEEVQAEVEKAKKGGFPRQLFKQMLMKAGVKDAGALKGILDGIEKQYGASGINPVKKSEDGGKVETPVTVEMLQKAAAFTPERTQALNDAFTTLKLVIEAITPGAMPATNTPESTNGLGASGIGSLSAGAPTPTIKNASSEVLETLGGIANTLKALQEGQTKLTERVDEVEKARPASNSVSEDGETETTTETKKSLWSGVL